jgi:hypothetical protein
MSLPPFRRLRAPAGDGERLADPPYAAVPDAVARNRARFASADGRIGDTPLARFRDAARAELFALLGTPDPGGPLLLTGHQPELCHPGVWAKTFATAGLAARLRGPAVNVVVDTDEVKSLSLKLPVADPDPARVHATAVPFDTGPADVPYAGRGVTDEAYFRSFPERIATITGAWGFDPLLTDAWRHVTATTGPLGDRFVAARSHFERAWDGYVPTVNVSALCRTAAFRAFAAHVLADRPRFVAVHNEAVRAYRLRAKLKSRTHPVPELREHEAPFWSLADGRRVAATATSDPATLAPRALTLTLFLRLGLADWFVHGLGGGKYDEVTDAILGEFFGVEPPGFQVVTGTLRLPLPTFPATPGDVNERGRALRALRWNPQRFVPAGAGRARAEWVEQRPATKAGRRARALAIRTENERLRLYVAVERERAEADLVRARAEVSANAVLRTREAAWVLYPESTLRPFLESARDDASGS